MSLSLTYINEDDRAYGLAGMAISLASLDAIDSVAEFCIDSEGPMVTFTSDYYYNLSPAVSPKSVWERLMRNFHITASMVISNVMARSIIRLGEDIPADVLSSLYDVIEEEGRDTCGLEDDEVKTFYDRTYARQRRIFTNPRLHPAVDELARIISRKRRLSGAELRDELEILQL